MHPKDLKWFELLNVDEAVGTIHFQHRRLLLFDADAMGLLRKELDQTLWMDRARLKKRISAIDHLTPADRSLWPSHLACFLRKEGP